MNRTNISWTDYTWNPIVGCSKISPGCANCYAEEVAMRFKFTGLKDDGTPLKWTKENASQNVILKRERLNEPHKVKKSQLVFTCSMSDIFHEQVPSEYILQIFKTMHECPQHQFQVLTKRPENMLDWIPEFPENMWLGVSVENKDTLHRIDTLWELEGISIKFLSIEPLLEDLGYINLSDIDWVIIGGESGHNHRPMDHAWVRNIRDQCKEQDVPYFFKQSAGMLPNHDPWIQEEHPLQRSSATFMPRNVNLPIQWLF